MRGSILVAAVAVAFSTGAIAADDAAQPAPAKSTALTLSDAELDQITAGGVVGVIIFNPGAGAVERLEGSPIVCVNCQALPDQLRVLGTGGLVVNPGNPNGRLLGNWRGAFPL